MKRHLFNALLLGLLLGFMLAAAITVYVLHNNKPDVVNYAE